METFSSYNKKLTGYIDVSETLKVIEKIAASALHKTNKNIQSLSKHSAYLQLLFSRIDSLENTNRHYQNISTDRQVSENSLVILISGDKGLVGNLWDKLFDSVSSIPNKKLLIIGKKGQNFFPESNQSIKHHTFQKQIPTVEEIEHLAEKLSQQLKDGKYTKITTVHLKSITLLDQEVEISQLLPIATISKQESVRTDVPGFPIIATSLSTLKTILSNKYLHTRLQQVILETAVSEFSARTVAMEHAGSKIDQQCINLSKIYSRDRRKHETQKQLERFISKPVKV